jgi:hypothetical protein
MMVGVIVLFAQQREAALSETINQRRAVDERTSRHIPDPPDEGVVLPERRLPHLFGRSAGYQFHEKHAERNCTCGPDSPVGLEVVQSSHVRIPAATNAAAHSRSRLNQACRSSASPSFSYTTSATSPITSK